MESWEEKEDLALGQEEEGEVVVVVVEVGDVTVGARMAAGPSCCGG